MKKSDSESGVVGVLGFSHTIMVYKDWSEKEKISIRGQFSGQKHLFHARCQIKSPVLCSS